MSVFVNDFRSHEFQYKRIAYISLRYQSTNDRTNYARTQSRTYDTHLPKEIDQQHMFMAAMEMYCGDPVKVRVYETERKCDDFDNLCLSF